MLNIEQSESVQLSSRFSELLKELRRGHVSRFPVTAKVVNPSSLAFYDSRFKEPRPLAQLFTPDGDTLAIRSSRIYSSRYTGHRKNEKHTKDPKKMLKYLREYTTPFTAKEVSSWSWPSYDNAVDNWKYQTRGRFTDAFHISPKNLLAEVMCMKAHGYNPQTPAFTKMVTEGIELAQRWERISSRKAMQVHVNINPDGTVDIYCSDSIGYPGLNFGTTSFQSLEHAPTVIREAVAMLNMVDPATLVPEVGMRTREQTYWVDVVAG